MIELIGRFCYATGIVIGSASLGNSDAPNWGMSVAGLLVALGCALPWAAKRW